MQLQLLPPNWLGNEHLRYCATAYGYVTLWDILQSQEGSTRVQHAIDGVNVGLCQHLGRMMLLLTKAVH